jgi:hypothetical protein
VLVSDFAKQILSITLACSLQTAFPPIDTATASLPQNQHFIFSPPLRANKEFVYRKQKTKQKE